MLEGQPDRLKRGGGVVIARRRVGQADIRAEIGVRQRGQTQQVVHDHMGHAGQRRAQLGDGLGPVDVAPSVVHAVAGDQHLGLDLLEAIEHGGGAHVGRAHAPDRAKAGHGQKADDRFGDVRQVNRHPVARLHAVRTQMQRQRGDLLAQRGPGQFLVIAALVAADECSKAGGMGGCDMAEHLARVVELRPLEPAHTRHLGLAEHRAVRRGRVQVEVIPDALPERSQVGGGPPPQGVIAVKAQATRVAQPVQVQADLGDEGRRHPRRLAAVAGLTYKTGSLRRQTQERRSARCCIRSDPLDTRERRPLD